MNFKFLLMILILFTLIFGTGVITASINFNGTSVTYLEEEPNTPLPDEPLDPNDPDPNVAVLE